VPWLRGGRLLPPGDDAAIAGEALGTIGADVDVGTRPELGLERCRS
jgi:hypothetical protein